MATLSPQILSGGHGALEYSLVFNMTMTAVLSLALLKIAASTISLGTGFRGGLFFSSLLVGALVGRALAMAITALRARRVVGYDIVFACRHGRTWRGRHRHAADNVVPRAGDDLRLWADRRRSRRLDHQQPHRAELFGYSFSTWRFHLRGETVRSARDVGWAREFTVARSIHERPSPDHSRSAVSGHASYSSRA